MNELTIYLKRSFNKRVLLDTGIVVDFLAGESKAKSFFEEHVFSGQLTPVISSQTVSELFMATRNKKEETELDQWLSKVFERADLNYEIAKQAGLLKRGNGIRVGDTVIAATALTLGVPLVTTIPESYRRAKVRTFKPYA